MYKGSLAYLILFVLCLVPNEAYFEISGIRLESYRIFLLSYAVINFQKFLNIRYEPFEKWIFIFCLWSLVSFVVVHGVAGVQSGLMRFLEVGVVYLIGRELCLFGGRISFKWALTLVALAFLCMAPFALKESIDGIRLTHVWAAELAGTYAESFLGESYFRHGVHRSSVVFSHPILFSITAMSVAVLTWYFYTGFWRYFLTLGYVVAGYTAMTSAGFAMIGIQVALIYLEKLTGRWPDIHRYALRFSILALMIIQVVVPGGAIRFLMNFVALNPDTAQARYMQWQYAWDDVMGSKVFGIGFGEWSRPWWMAGSIDSYWLTMALQNGLVGLFLVAVFWITMTNFVFTVYKTTKDKYVYLIFCALCALIFAGVTVAFFDRAQPLIYLFIGLMSGYAIRQKVLSRNIVPSPVEDLHEATGNRYAT